MDDRVTEKVYTYSPDWWLIVKINGQTPHYRVFGAWSGGYLDGDSWRLNSGIVRVEEDEKHFYFIGHSGSSYRCNKKAYGSNAYGYSVVTNFCDKSEGTAEYLKEMPDVMSMDWIIK